MKAEHTRREVSAKFDTSNGRNLAFDAFWPGQGNSNFQRDIYEQHLNVFMPWTVRDKTQRQPKLTLLDAAAFKPFEPQVQRQLFV
jgi:hypothetical protein